MFFVTAATALLAASGIAAAPSNVLNNRQNSNSSTSNSTSAVPPIKILQGGYNSSYAILEYNPFVTPATLRIAARFSTSEGNLKPWLSRHPQNPNIIIGVNDYAVPNGTGYMTSYSLNPQTGQLTYIDAVNTGGFPVPLYGVAAAHCAFFPDGRAAAAANYFGQSAAMFTFDPLTGRFGSQINRALLEFPGYVPVAGQKGVAGNDNSSQATSHPHQIVTHPFLPFFYLPDLGTDLLRVFRIGANNSLTNFTTYQQPLGSGPRHLAISPDGRYLYLLHELDASLRTYSIDATSGNLTQLGTDLPIYPSNATLSTNISAAEVYVSNDGRYVYASNRNLTLATLIQPSDPSDTITAWSVSPTNGTLTRIQSAMAPGARQIRSFELSPPGYTASEGGQDFVVVGSLRTDTTYVFLRNRTSGLLTLSASVGATYMPATYLWL